MRFRLVYATIAGLTFPISDQTAFSTLGERVSGPIPRERIRAASLALRLCFDPSKWFPLSAHIESLTGWAKPKLQQSDCNSSTVTDSTPLCLWNIIILLQRCAARRKSHCCCHRSFNLQQSCVFVMDILYNFSHALYFHFCLSDACHCDVLMCMRTV